MDTGMRVDADAVSIVVGHENASVGRPRLPPARFRHDGRAVRPLRASRPHRVGVGRRSSYPNGLRPTTIDSRALAPRTLRGRRSRAVQS
jgi:hypothetical protein